MLAEVLNEEGHQTIHEKAFMKIQMRQILDRERILFKGVKKMSYKFIKANQENRFYSVTENEIKEVEKELDLKFPKELVHFYIEVGYGFIKGSGFNINRIMDLIQLEIFD